MSMKFKSATDFRKSLEMRLNSFARNSGQDLQRLRRKVAFDRLLARIFQKTDSPQFLLKGGYAMELRFEKARATKDIDLTYLERFNKTALDIPQGIFQVLRDYSQIDLNDFFVYQIGQPELELDNAPYGGARFPVSCFLDGKLFVRFQIDIGLDILVNHVDKIKGKDWLDFCDIPSPLMPMITREQQFAEKIHAYTLPRNGKINSRVKDLIDLVLLLGSGGFSLEKCRIALKVIFKARGTHLLPGILLAPPPQWSDLFQKLAKECGLNPELMHAFDQVNNFYEQVQIQTIS